MDQNTLFLIAIIGGFIIWTFIKRTKDVGLKISISDAKKRLDEEKGIVLLDVRTRDEYNRRRIPNSILIPVDVLENEAVKKLPNKDTEIFVYCASGNRSSRAVRTLRKLGYNRVFDLGGISRWPYETVSGNK